MLLAGAVGEVVNVFDRERGSSGAPRKDWYAALKAHLRVCDAPKQGFDELINALAGLAGKMSESFLQRGASLSFGRTSSPAMPFDSWSIARQDSSCWPRLSSCSDPSRCSAVDTESRRA